MESKVEKYAKKQNQLQEQVKELYAKNNILENKISVLNECLSLDKIKKKVFELENKQKLLASLESMVSKLKTDVKQLDYLKQILQRQLEVSSLSTTDIIGEQTNLETSQSTVNSGCAIETLDSSSDVDSEESIMVLSDYDVVADEEVLECSEKPVGKKVLYSEALLMASSMHSLLPESPSTSVGSNVQLNYKDIMNTSSRSEKFLKMYDVVNKQHLPSNNKHDKIKLKCDTGKDESPVLKLDQSHVLHEEINNHSVKPLDIRECDYVTSLVDSWIKVNKNKLLETLTKTNLSIDKIEGIAKSQKYNMSETNAEVKATHLPIDQLCNNQFVSKNINTIKSGEHISHAMDFNNKMYNSVLSTSIQDYEFPIKPLSLNIEDINVIDDCNKPKVNVDVLEVPNNVQNDRLCNEFESKELNTIKNFENLCNYEDCNDKNVTHKSICSANVTKSELLIKSSLLKSENINVLKEYNTQKGDVDICEVLDTPTPHVQHDKICNTFKPEESCENTNLKNEVLINSLLFNTDSESSDILKECNDLSASISIEQSPHNNDETSTGSSFINEFGDLSLNVNILKGIQQHGYQNLTALQRKCLYHCMNGQDIIFYSYPCIGKSTMCIISVLERIDTSLNECQAIYIVPTFKQALSTEKMIKSFGKFLDVSTCIGGTNVPRKVSPVPHVIVSTLQDLCDMIKFNSLCKDFIKILIFDDADELFKYGLFNQIRYVLLFLNSNRQLIIGSSSRLEEILDQFSDVMQNPEYIIVPDDKPCLDDISQYYINVTEEWKFDAICELYEMFNLSNAVIYCNTWDKSLKVAEDMRLKTYTVSVVHNEMDTSQRRLILQQFRSCTSRVLVTMELLKGEDFLDVLWVINYDLPKCPKEYVRRIVGCFKRNVKVINFITYDDAIAKENIEAAFNMQMAYFSKNATGLHLSDSINQL